MDARFLSPVISELQRKTQSGSSISQDVYPIGADQKHIFPLTGTNNSNLLEQLLIGSDRIVKSQYDETNSIYRETIEFRSEDINNEYYYLERYSYYSPSNGMSAYVQGNRINFEQGSSAEYSGQENVYVDGNDIYFTDTMFINGSILEELEYNDNFVYNPNTNSFYISTKVTLELCELYYKGAEGENDILISTKLSTRSYEGNKMIVKDVITKKYEEKEGN